MCIFLMAKHILKWLFNRLHTNISCIYPPIMIHFYNNSPFGGAKDMAYDIHDDRSRFT